jgi:hypothetical protein
MGIIQRLIGADRVVFQSGQPKEIDYCNINKTFVITTTQQLSFRKYGAGCMPVYDHVNSTFYDNSESPERLDLDEPPFSSLLSSQS